MDLADLMAVLYGEVMHFDPKNPRDPDRDWLVLSKGHAGPVAYATFGLMGFYPMEDAYTLNQPHTRFPSHTDRKLTPGVDLTTGSLGQGASTAAGAALGNKIDGRTNHVFCVVGDGEADEGQVWEAAMTAAHFALDTVCAIVDDNGVQLDGPTCEVMNVAPLADKFRAFGWQVLSVDGHSLDALAEAFHQAATTRGRPTVLLARTVKGKGVSFMEGQPAWHGKAPNDQELAAALAELAEGGTL